MNRIAKNTEIQCRHNMGDRLVRIPIDEVVQSNTPTARTLPAGVQSELPFVRTDLDQFSDTEAFALLLHGRAIAKRALQRKYGDALKYKDIDDAHLWNALPDNKRLRKIIFAASRLRWWNLFNFRDWATYPFVVILTLLSGFIGSLGVIYSNVYHSFNDQLETAITRADSSAQELAKARKELDDLKIEYSGLSATLQAAKRQLEATISAPLRTCRIPANGIERYARSFSVTRNSDWRSGGSNPVEWCNVVLTQVRAENPGARVQVSAPMEESRDSCRPLNCRQYRYTCTVAVEADPIYKAASSPECHD
jgi:hypothetical protein